MRNRHLAFRLVCTSGGLCQELLVGPHSGGIWALFRCAADLDKVALAAFFRDTKTCALPTWAKRFRDAYEGRWDSDECLLDLMVVAWQLFSDTGQIEARNAGIRRAMFSCSVHTHQMHLEAASADFVIRHCQKHQASPLHDVVGEGAAGDDDADGDGEPQQKKARTCGGVLGEPTYMSNAQATLVLTLLLLLLSTGNYLLRIDSLILTWGSRDLAFVSKACQRSA